MNGPSPAPAAPEKQSSQRMAMGAGIVILVATSLPINSDACSFCPQAVAWCAAWSLKQILGAKAFSTRLIYKKKTLKRGSTIPENQMLSSHVPSVQLCVCPVLLIVGRCLLRMMNVKRGVTR